MERNNTYQLNIVENNLGSLGTQSQFSGKQTHFFKENLDSYQETESDLWSSEQPFTVLDTLVKVGSLIFYTGQGFKTLTCVEVLKN